MGLVEKFKEMEREKKGVETRSGFLRYAIEGLKNNRSIKKFYQECVDNCEGGADWANPTIGWVLGFYDKKTWKKWMETLPKIKDPFCGRNYPGDFSDEESKAIGSMAVAFGLKGAQQYAKIVKNKKPDAINAVTSQIYHSCIKPR